MIINSSMAQGRRCTNSAGVDMMALDDGSLSGMFTVEQQKHRLMRGYALCSTLCQMCTFEQVDC